MSILSILGLAALAVWLLGTVVFLVFFRELVLGEWFQAVVTALLWPVLLAVLLVTRP